MKQFRFFTVILILLFLLGINQNSYSQAVAGVDQAICSNTTMLDANNPMPLLGMWSVVEGNAVFENTALYNTVVTNLAEGDNIISWTVDGESDDVYIHNGLPSGATAGPDRTVCADYAMISANNPAKFDYTYWKVYSGGGIITGEFCSNSICTAQVDNMSTGENVFVWHVIKEYEGPIAPYTVENPLICELTDTIIITYNSITASAGEDIYICADTVQLFATQASAGYTGQWLGAGSIQFVTTGANTSTLYNDIVTSLTTGRNSFTWTVTDGYCYDSDIMVVWNNLPNPQASVMNDLQVICDDEAQLLGSPSDLPEPVPSIYSYYYGEWTTTSGVTIAQPSSYNTWVYGLPEQQSSFFVWHVYNNFDDGIYAQTCETTDTIEIYNNTVHADAGTKPSIICGQAGDFAETN